MNRKADRLPYIDIAKGFAILMVIAGHILDTSQGLKYFLYTIHVPLFLLLSGFFEKKQKNEPSYLLKTFRRLYLPCMCIITTDYVFYTLIYKADILRDTIPRILRNFVGYSVTFDTPIWFLIDLFFVKLLFRPIHLIRNKTAQRIVVGLIIAAGTVYMFMSKHIAYDNIYFAIYAVPVVLTYYSLGFLLKDLIALPSVIFLEKDSRKKKIIIAVMAVCLTYVAVISQFNGNVGVLGLKLGNPAIFLSASLLGAYGVIILSVLLASTPKINTRPLEYLGRHTLFLMATHYYLVEYLAKYILKKAGKSHIYFHPVVELIIFLSTMVICLTVLFIKNRSVSLLSGKTRQKSEIIAKKC